MSGFLRVSIRRSHTITTIYGVTVEITETRPLITGYDLFLIYTDGFSMCFIIMIKQSLRAKALNCYGDNICNVWIIPIQVDTYSK